MDSKNRYFYTLLILFLLRDGQLQQAWEWFVGPYLTDEARRRFERDYNLFNVGLMAVPVDDRAAFARQIII
jgi:hypothetical protein